ncbi:MFS transporter [Kitasatospora aureofaciens]|uniref:MFS transporter n=1 Tax=Kitasatospora aureofaciens TaxID=1894 RepID=UPI001C44C899|nr:MFS transporter [Kitasatospora aureofaciens]MBV6698372.1 MFS transporter [Kitasatospora aureofaciens]
MSSDRRAWAAVAVVCAALFLLGLDFTVLNVAIPRLRAELGPTLAETQWIVDGYALALGGCVLAAGALGDRYGRRRAFLAGLALCGLASVAGATGDGAARLVAARCGMGLGAALFMPATLSTVVHVLREPAARRRAIGIWAAVAGVGAVFGPVAGGLLVERYGWQAAFWLNVPVITVIAAAALVVLPESRDPEARPLDRPGALLSCAGLLALVWGVIEAPGRGWNSAGVLAAFAVAAALLAAFVRRQLRCTAPMVPVRLLGGGPVWPATLSLALMSFAMFGAMFLLTLYLQQVRGLSAWQAGLRMVPLSVGLATGAILGPLLARQLGARVPSAGGLLLIAAGFVQLGRLAADFGDAPVLVFESLAGVGAGLLAPVATEVVMSAVPAGLAGVGSALNDATRQVGSTLGVAVLGSVLATALTDAAPGDPAAFTDAFVDGLTAAAVVGATVAVLAAALAWRRLPGRRPRPVLIPEPD